MKVAALGALVAGLLSSVAHADELPWWMQEHRIIGRNNLEPIEAAIDGQEYQWAKAVARVETAEGMGFCTGFKIGEDLMMTNFHCYDYKPNCEEIRFTFDYESKVPADKRLSVKCKEVLAVEESLDFALYRIETPKIDFSGDRGSSQPTLPTSLKIWAGELKEGQALISTSHPRARLKEIDRSADCKVYDAAVSYEGGRRTIKHSCDTEGGSSGSPVLDKETGHVVAIHWGGYYNYNMAIPMSLIVEELEGKLDEATFSELTIEK